jgi:REP element-mobilizing transposase RayT
MCVPAATYLVTRTCDQRMYLLKPGSVIAQVVLYCLFRAANQFGVLIHAISVESNHLHLVVTDPRGELSEFMKWFDRHVAMCLIAHYRRTHPQRHLEAIWSKHPFSATLLLTENAILDAIVYTLTNPVKDGLVPDYRKWPGLNNRPTDWLQPTRYAPRPSLYFDQRKREWAEVSYQFTIPPQLSDRTPGLLVRDVEAMIAGQENALRTSRSGRGFAGVQRVLGVDPFDSPDTVRPKGKLNPRLAAGGDTAALKQGMLALRLFRDAYREAFKAFRRGLAVVFPAGTYLMRRLYGVACHALDASWCARALPS